MEISIGKIYQVMDFYFKCFEETGSRLYGIDRYTDGRYVYDYWYKPFAFVPDNIPEHIQEFFSDPLLEIEYWKLKG